MIIVALLAAVSAAWLAVPRRWTARRLVPPPAASGDGRGRPAALAGAMLFAVMIGGALAAGTRGLAVATAAATVGGALGWSTLRTLRQRRAASIRREVVAACRLLGRLVASGRIPTEALALAAHDFPVLAEAAAGVALGADPADLWHAASRRPGCGGLDDLARAWRVAWSTGAPVRRPLELVANGLAAEQRTRAVVDAELAAPRATGRLLAALPLVGLGLARGLGADPVAFLLDRTVGQMCLIAGAVLAAIGVIWVETIADRAGGAS